MFGTRPLTNATKNWRNKVVSTIQGCTQVMAHRAQVTIAVGQPSQGTTIRQAVKMPGIYHVGTHQDSGGLLGSTATAFPNTLTHFLITNCGKINYLGLPGSKITKRSVCKAIKNFPSACVVCFPEKLEFDQPDRAELDIFDSKCSN